MVYETHTNQSSDRTFHSNQYLGIWFNKVSFGK